MTQDEWSKKITYRVFVDDSVTLGELTEMLYDMWVDAHNEGEDEVCAVCGV